MLDNKFEKRLQNIYFHVAQYGAAKEFSLNEKPEDFNPKRFHSFCLEGFKIGQKLALQELIALNNEHLEIQELKKNQSNRDERENLAIQLKIIKYKKELIKNLVYTIAWQMLEGKREVLARLYTGEKGENSLEGVGFQAILDTANEINQDPNKFALISDLTNNIQIGDLLVIGSDSFKVIEVKIGEKNKHARNLIAFYKLNNINITEERLNLNLDKKLARQVFRMHKQDLKLNKFKQIVSEDEGDHPKFEGVKVNLIDNSIPNLTFDEKIGELLDELKNKDSAYTNISGIINIGAYKNKWVSTSIGQKTLEKINKFPVYNAIGLGMNISEPIFAKTPYWGNANIMDIALGKIHIYIGVNFDLFIEYANDLGLPLRWSTRKEFNNFIQKLKIDKEKGNNINQKEIFSLNNKGLVIESDKKTAFIGTGMFSKIIYDHIHPYTLIQNKIMFFKNIDKN